MISLGLLGSFELHKKKIQKGLFSSLFNFKLILTLFYYYDGMFLVLVVGTSYVAVVGPVPYTTWFDMWSHKAWSVRTVHGCCSPERAARAAPATRLACSTPVSLSEPMWLKGDATGGRLCVYKMLYWSLRTGKKLVCLLRTCGLAILNCS